MRLSCESSEKKGIYKGILQKILKRTSPKAHGIEVKSESYA